MIALVMAGGALAGVTVAAVAVLRQRSMISAVAAFVVFQAVLAAFAAAMGASVSALAICLFGLAWSAAFLLAAHALAGRAPASWFDGGWIAAAALSAFVIPALWAWPTVPAFVAPPAAGGLRMHGPETMGLALVAAAAGLGARAVLGGGERSAFPAEAGAGAREDAVARQAVVATAPMLLVLAAAILWAPQEGWAGAVAGAALGLIVVLYALVFGIRAAMMAAPTWALSLAMAGGVAAITAAGLAGPIRGEPMFAVTPFLDLAPGVNAGALLIAGGLAAVVASAFVLVFLSLVARAPDLQDTPW